MDDVIPPPPPSTRPTTPSLRRRNSIATSLSLPSIPTSLAAIHSSTTITSSGATSTTSASSTLSGDLEFISIIKPSSSSYTSIRDLLPSPAAVHSPTPSSSSVAGHSGCEISIRNRLVKQAAWAYLQPMSTSPELVARNFVHRIWFRISGDLVITPVVALFRFIVDWILRAFRVQSSR